MRQPSRCALVAALLAVAPLAAYADIIVQTPPESISQTIAGSVSGPGSFASPTFNLPSLAPALVQSPATITPLTGNVALLINQTATDPSGLNRIDGSQSNIQYVTISDPSGFRFGTVASSTAEADFDLAAGQTGSADVKVTSQISKTVNYIVDTFQLFSLDATFNYIPSSLAGNGIATGAAGQTDSMSIDVIFQDSLLAPFHADTGAGDTGLTVSPMIVPPGTIIKIETTVITSASLDVALTGPDTSDQIQQSSIAYIDVNGTVPEPASLGLLALPALALLGSRRRRRLAN